MKLRDPHLGKDFTLDLGLPRTLNLEVILSAMKTLAILKRKNMFLMSKTNFHNDYYSENAWFCQHILLTDVVLFVAEIISSLVPLSTSLPAEIAMGSLFHLEY